MFSYKKGKIQTDKPWNKPSVQSLWQLSEDKHQFFQKYKCYVYGALSQNLDTWDTDLLVVSDINDQVGIDCVRVCNHAHDMHQLVDISIVSQQTVDIYTEQVKHFNTTGEWKLPTDIIPDADFAFYKPHDEVYKNGELISEDHREYTPVAKNLWKVSEHRPLSNKLKARKQLGVPVLFETFIKTIFNESDK